MKRYFYILIAFCLFGCEDPGGAADKTQVADSIPQAKPKATMIDTSMKDRSQIGFELYTSETVGELRSGLPPAQVVNAMGAPEKRSAIEFWEADGHYHQSWEYTGVELDMSGEDSNKLSINALLLTSPTRLKTSRNIGIGSSSAEVESAYGKYFNKEESSDSVWVAGSIYGGLIFNLKNNKVARIFLGAAAE